MCLVLGVIGDEGVATASRRALDGLLPFRSIQAAAELPGAVSAQRPLVVIASPNDRFGDPVLPYVVNLRGLLPQIGLVWISDIAGARTGAWELSPLGEIRSLKAASREYAADLRAAVEEQAERYRAQYVLRAFTPHTPSILLPLLQHCAHTWGKKLTADEVAAALKHNRRTVTRWVRSAQPACGLREVLRWHHFLDITWRLWARREPFKPVARAFKYRREARLRGKVRHWLDIDVREPSLADVRSWENLVDRFVDELAGHSHAAAPDHESPQH